MKNTFAILSLLVLLSLGFACGTTYYSVSTHGGKTYTSAGKPDYDEDSKAYHFKDADGHEVILNQSQIKEIRSIAK